MSIVQNALSVTEFAPLSDDELSLAGGEFKAGVYLAGIGLIFLAGAAAASGIGAGAAIGLGAAGVAVAESAF